MSRIGNRIITVPTGVTVEETNGVVTVKGPKGSLSQPMLKDITIFDTMYEKNLEYFKE